MPAVSPRTIISGEPGTVFVNETDRPLYQIHAAGFNTCGLCWSYSEKIARFWPIPLHFNCRCRQTVVKPGQQATKPFINYEAAILELPPEQRAKVMGASLFKLWRAGVIEYGDAVTAARVRSAEQVIAIKRITVRTMMKAGIEKSLAERLYSAVHTPEHEAVNAHRRELLHKLSGAGVSHDLVVKHIGEAIASRATIAAGPNYTTKTGTPAGPAGPAGTVLPGIAAGRPTDAAETRRRHADELATLLGSPAAIRKATAAMGRPPQLPEAARRVVEKELGASAGRSVAAFVAEVAAGLAAGRLYGDDILSLFRRYAK